MFLIEKKKSLLFDSIIEAKRKRLRGDLNCALVQLRIGEEQNATSDVGSCCD